jgi:hypothetical protein
VTDAARKYDLYGHDFKRDPHPTFAAMRRDPAPRAADDLGDQLAVCTKVWDDVKSA